MAGERDQAPAAGEVTEVGATMAREAVEGAQADDQADLAGEPGTVSERAVAGRRGDAPTEDPADDPTDQAP